MKAMILTLAALTLTSAALAKSEKVAQLRASYSTGYIEDLQITITIEQTLDGSRLWDVSTYDGKTEKTNKQQVIPALISDSAADGPTEVKLSNGMAIVCVNQGFMAPGTRRKKNPCTLSFRVGGGEQRREAELHLFAGIVAE